MFTFGSGVKGLTERHKKIYFHLLYDIPPYKSKLEWMEYFWKFLCSSVNPLTALCLYICYFQNLPFSQLGVGLEGKLLRDEWAFYKNTKHRVLKKNNRAFKQCKENNNQYHWISVIWFQKWLLPLKFELNFAPILHINYYTSLIHMCKKYFEVWMNYNTLTLNTYKVKLVLINIL